MRSMIRVGATVLCCLLMGMGCAKEEKVPHASTQVVFEKEMMPVFSRSCGVCHRREGGNDKAVLNGVFYETADDVQSIIGSYIIPGKPEESGLLKVLNQSLPVGEGQIVMPPPSSDVPRWSEVELALFSLWIKQGAKME